MIKLNVLGQKLEVNNLILASGTHNYITAKATFTSEWDDVDKILHFKNDSGSHAVNFVEDEIPADSGVDITAGTWEMWITGMKTAAATLSNLNTLTWTLVDNKYWKAKLLATSLTSSANYTLDTLAHVVAGTTPNTMALSENVIYVYNVSTSTQPSGSLAYIEILKRATTQRQIVNVMTADGGSEEGGDFPAFSPSDAERIFQQLADLENKKIDEPLQDGTNGQVLTTDGQGGRSWTTVQGGGSGTSDYSQLSNKPKINNVELSGNKSTTDLGINIPSKTSELTNDSGFLTEHQSLSAYRTASAQDVIDASKYEKPESGIPKSDLNSSVQASLNLADSAIQEHQSLSAYRTSSAQDLIDAGKVTEPSSEGSDGQVLATDGAGARYWKTVSGGSGTSDYNDLSNRPKINNVTLSGNKTTADLGIVIPTKTSDLTNDGDGTNVFLTQHQSLVGYATQAWVNAQGFITSLVGYATEAWVNAQGFLKEHQSLSAYRTSSAQDAIDATKANTADLATVATSGSYNDLSNKPTIPTVPTNVSAFTNDAGYLTSHQSLSAYRTASAQDVIDSGKEAKGKMTLSGTEHTVITHTVTIVDGGVTTTMTLLGV